ncbi:MAG: hypothetical protein DRO23_06405 [Thermoprotei archaeon]|nr:MAG: hypothetical protein DRO23_06405 [Thermoprotei archaeon]
MYSLVILAGGLSQRLGSAYKPLVRLKNKALIRLVVENLEELFTEVIIVVKSEKQKNLLKPILKDKNVIFTLDSSIFENGPLVAMYTGALKAQYSKLFIIASDYPFIESNLALKLLEKLSEYEAAIPMWPNGYIEPLVGSYRREPLVNYSYKALMKGLRRAREPLNYMKTCYVNVYELTPIPEIVFHNINTIEDLVKAEKFYDMFFRREFT